MRFGDQSFQAAAAAQRVLIDAAPRPACLIVGLGNCLLRDDGIGVHVARQLMDDPPAGALVLEVGTDVFSAVPFLENVGRVLAIDAMDAGGRPGALYLCPARDIRTEALRVSLHEMGLLSVLEFVPRTRWPEITVLGVQPDVINYGLELSPALQHALPRAVEAARDIVEGWSSSQELDSSSSFAAAIQSDRFPTPICEV